MQAERECLCVIGLSHEYSDIAEPEMTISDLLSNGDYAVSLADFRNFSMHRFLFCPYCGKKIDWKDIKKQAKLRNKESEGE